MVFVREIFQKRLIIIKGILKIASWKTHHFLVGKNKVFLFLFSYKIYFFFFSFIYNFQVFFLFQTLNYHEQRMNIKLKKKFK